MISAARKLFAMVKTKQPAKVEHCLAMAAKCTCFLSATYHLIRNIEHSPYMNISINGEHLHLYLQCLLSSYLQIRNAPDDYSNKSNKDNNNEN